MHELSVLNTGQNVSAPKIDSYLLPFDSLMSHAIQSSKVAAWENLSPPLAMSLKHISASIHVQFIAVSSC